LFNLFQFFISLSLSLSLSLSPSLSLSLSSLLFSFSFSLPVKISKLHFKLNISLENFIFRGHSQSHSKHLTRCFYVFLSYFKIGPHDPNFRKRKNLMWNSSNTFFVNCTCTINLCVFVCLFCVCLFFYSFLFLFLSV